MIKKKNLTTRQLIAPKTTLRVGGQLFGERLSILYFKSSKFPISINLLILWNKIIYPQIYPKIYKIAQNVAT